jgi:hypothetical protein
VIEKWTGFFKNVDGESGEVIWVLVDGFLLYWNQVGDLYSSFRRGSHLDCSRMWRINLTFEYSCGFLMNICDGGDMIDTGITLQVSKESGSSRMSNLIISNVLYYTIRFPGCLS